MSVEDSKVNKVEEKFQDWQDDIESRVRSLQTGSYARILKMARKPTKVQFRQTMIVCGIGMFILGLFGFGVQANALGLGVFFITRGSNAARSQHAFAHGGGRFGCRRSAKVVG